MVMRNKKDLNIYIVYTYSIVYYYHGDTLFRGGEMMMQGLKIDHIFICGELHEVKYIS